MSKRTCVECATRFEGRWDAKTCSDKCRKRLSRRVSRSKELTPLDQRSSKRAVDLRERGLEVLDPSVTSVVDAVQSGDRLAEMFAVKLRLAQALDSDTTPPSALAPLSRVLAEVNAEIEDLHLQGEELRRNRLKVVADESWDENSI